MIANIKDLREALESSRNAAQVARQFNLPLHQVYHFAKTRKISLRPQGRPQKYTYNKTDLMRAIRRAMNQRGGLLKLSIRKGIPYHVITNMVKKMKEPA
jgi:YD repeat-containing protein